MPDQTTTTPVVKETAGMLALNLRDLALGAIVAAAASVVAIVWEAWQAGGLDAIKAVDWNHVLQTAIAAFTGYIGKNFFTKKKTIVLAPKEEVKITDSHTGATLTPTTNPV